jgi:hypothetical protein
VTEKRRVRNRWQYSRNPIDKTVYNALTRRLRTALQSIRNATFESYITNLSADDHSIWKTTKSFRRPAAHIPPILRDDRTWCITDDDRAASFASYLSQVFTTPKAHPTSTLDDQILTYLDSACPMSMPNYPFSHTEILAEIIRISPRKAPGFGLLTGRILKELPKEATTLLTTIYNSMLRLTYFPITWKFVQVIMIPKPGKPAIGSRRIDPLVSSPSCPNSLKDSSSNAFKWILTSTN